MNNMLQKILVSKAAEVHVFLGAGILPVIFTGGQSNTIVTDAFNLPPQTYARVYIYVDRSFTEFIERVACVRSLVDDQKELHIAVKSDIFEFLDSLNVHVASITAERIFEHLSYTDGSIGRVIEACHRVLIPGGHLDIVVPNAAKLAKTLLSIEDGTIFQKYHEKHGITMTPASFNNIMLVLNTEFTNCSTSDPHQSIWSPALTHTYFEGERTLIIDDIDENYVHANRDIYMKIHAVKPIK